MWQIPSAASPVVVCPLILTHKLATSSSPIPRQSSIHDSLKQSPISAIPTLPIFPASLHCSTPVARAVPPHRRDANEVLALQLCIEATPACFSSYTDLCRGIRDGSKVVLLLQGKCESLPHHAVSQAHLLCLLSSLQVMVTLASIPHV